MSILIRRLQSKGSLANRQIFDNKAISSTKPGRKATEQFDHPLIALSCAFPKEMSLNDSSRLIAHGLSNFKKVIEADTDVSTIDLNLLENLNTNQFLNYIKLEQDISVLESETERAELLEAEFNLLLEDLSQIEHQVDKLNQISHEALIWVEHLEKEIKMSN